MKPKEFIAHLDDSRVIQAIQAAESRTSGEIAVFVATTKSDSIEEAAAKQFAKMGLQKTALRNAVLFYFAPQQQQFYLLGDSGIHAKVGPDFWEEATGEMSELLKKGAMTDALVQGITKVGAQLAQHFPRSEDDKNEIPDQIVRG